MIIRILQKKSIILPVDNNNPDNYYEGPSPASEKETKFIVNLMDKINFDAIITLHSPYKVVNYDGDNGGKALKLPAAAETEGLHRLCLPTDAFLQLPAVCEHICSQDGHAGKDCFS